MSCGPKAFVKGGYDDVNRENLLNDEWSETDMQKTVAELVGSLMAHPTIANAKTPPLVMEGNLQNNTSEHIDTQSIMDMVRFDLMNGGKVAFVDKEARQDVADEYAYQNSAWFRTPQRKVQGVKLAQIS